MYTVICMKNMNNKQTSGKISNSRRNVVSMKNTKNTIGGQKNE